MDAPLWIFAYGSLIWSPDSEPAKRGAACLAGYERRFCLYSISYRGTLEQPGLVLALDRLSGSECHGLALAARLGEEEAVLAALRARELARPACPDFNHAFEFEKVIHAVAKSAQEKRWIQLKDFQKPSD